MANYPPPPNHRLAYDIDGTRVFRWQSPGVLGTELSAAEVALLNNEATNTYGSGTGGGLLGLVFLFPEMRNITHAFARNAGVSISNLTAYGSANTTNGEDGTWLSMGGLISLSEVVYPDYRSMTALSPARTVRALRLSGTAYAGMEFRVAHVYGAAVDPAYGLSFIAHDSDTALPASFWDWGDASGGTTDSRQFRIKNISADYDAKNVSLTMSALSDPAPAFLTDLTLSADGGTSWAGSLTLGDLDSMDISPVLTLRRVSPLSAGLGLRSPRLRAAAASWEAAA